MVPQDMKELEYFQNAGDVFVSKEGFLPCGKKVPWQ